MKITNVKVYGLAESIVASGLPMLAGFDESEFDRDCYAVGGWLNEAARLADGDAGRHLRRAKTLSSCEGGESHDCFLCGIIVQMNLTAPRYWWPEFQRYHFADIVSSTSTMHRLKSFAKAYSDAVALFGTNLNAAGMNTIVGYVYDMLYGDSGGFPSYASAAALILFAIVFTITVINLAISRRRAIY